MSDGTTTGQDEGTEHVDLLVIGAGSGNTLPHPDHHERRILVADDAPWFGGTCLNVGCIPTKMLVHVADLLRDARDGERLGLRDVTGRVDWRAVRDRVFGRIDEISTSGEEYRRSGEPNIGLVRETVRFVDPRTVRSASGRTIEADRIVVAVGSRPRALPGAPFGAFDGRVHSTDTIMRIDELPRRIAIIGGGVSACEFAAMFSGFGVEVTQLVRSSLLRGYDTELTDRFTAVARDEWDVRTGVSDPEVTAHGDVLRVRAGDETVDVDLVLVAAGRVPNTDRLGSREIGLDHHDDGRLVVDAYQRVLAGGEVVPGLFALGDVDSPHQLKHVANEEARIVRQNLFADDADLVANTLAPVPHAVFTHPQIAVVGRTLDAARAEGLDAFEVVHEYGWTAWGWALEDTTSFVKLVVERGSGALVGAHIMGPDAAILVQPLVTAASLGHSVRGLARAQYWPHPAASEVVENALLRAEEEL